MKNIYLGLKFAFSYFTILPVNFKSDDDLSSNKVLASMLFFIPLSGMIIGFAVISLYQLLGDLGWFGAVIAASSYMILYGFLHTEAVIDVFDALYARHGGKDPYEIIKEPTVGAVGVLYGVVFTILKISAVAYFLFNNLFFEFLTVIIVGRLALLALIYTHSFRSSFLEQLKTSLDIKTLIGAFIFYCIFGYMILDIDFFVILTAGVLLASLISTIIERRLGFSNGDVLGCTLETVEILLFVLISLIASSI